MKIFEWMQKRINGKKISSSILAPHHYMVHEASKQEFSDWPQELLAIGTFGNKNNLKKDSASFQNCTHEFSLEEVGNLENEVNINFVEEQEEEIDGNFYTSTNNLVYMSSRGRERCLDSSKSTGVSKKSLSFLLKKMFVCKSGLSTPSFKDPFSTESRMEKILRAGLHKKIHPQSSCSSSSSTTFLKKYQLEKNPMPHSDDDEDEEEFAADVNKGIKWVKTDTEYIVLEI